MRDDYIKYSLVSLEEWSLWCHWKQNKAAGNVVQFWETSEIEKNEKNTKLAINKYVPGSWIWLQNNAKKKK